MSYLTSTSFRRAIIVKLLILLFFSVSCHADYTGQHFSFPPGSKPHNNDWRYAGQVIVSSNQTPITKKSRKKVRIKVYDKNKTNFLNEDFEFVSASIRANVVWEKFEEISIELIEVGNIFAEDSYNKHLLKSGPNKLLNLMYKYDQQDRKFKKVPQ